VIGSVGDIRELKMEKSIALIVSITPVPEDVPLGIYHGKY